MSGKLAQFIPNHHLRLGRRLGLAVIASALVFACLPASALADGSSISGSFVSAQGNPVPNVNVTLVGAVSSEGFSSPTATTDGNGDFVFTAVPDGTYGISFYSDGSCGSPWAQYYATQSGISAQASDAEPITVAGSDVGGVTVTCPQTYAISGNVSGPSGKPLANISIQAQGNNASAGTDSLADGSFSITGLTPGSYTLSVEDDSGVYQGGWAGPTGIVQTSFQAAALTITSSDLTGISITLPKALSISGHVRDANGNPLAGLNVTFGGIGFYLGSQSVTTAADGSFTILGGSPDQSGYVVVSDPNGTYAPGIWSRTGLTADPNKANEISLGAGSVKNLNIVAKLGGSISGTVLAADGTPLQSAYISPLLWANGAVVQTNLPGMYGSVSGPDGTFSVSDLAPATYVLQVGLPNGGSGYYSSAGLVSDAAAATPVDISAAAVSGLTIQVPASTYYTVSGNLVGSDGNPVANASLYLQSTASASGVELMGGTDGSGDFSIANVPSGTYHLQIQPANGTNAYLGGYLATDGSVTSDPAQAAAIEVSADTSLNLTIPVAEHITGKVVMPNGIPVFRPAVQASSGGVLVGNPITQPDGSFDVAVPAGSYQVVLDYGGGTGDGYYSASAPGAFTFDQTSATLVASTSDGGQGLTIVQPPLPQIAGRLFDGKGKPLANSYVFLYTVGSSTLPSMTMTNAAGWFAADTAPGKYLVLVGGNGDIIDAGRGGPVGPLETPYSQQGWYTRHAKDHFTLNQAKASVVTVGASGVYGLTVTIPNTVSISGTVRGPNGKGVAGIRADALDPTTGAVVASGITAPKGTYSIAGLNSGQYKVRFVDPAGVFNVGYAGKNGTVNNIARAAVIKLGTTNKSRINATLTMATN